jgi:uncharacterized protein
MSGETNLQKLIKNMIPQLNEGDYVYCTVDNLTRIDIEKVISIFKEAEAYTIIIKKSLADELGLTYSYIAAWITLTVHSSLDAVGLTAAFSNALADNGISCNVVAAYYHDHIFVNKDDAEKAMSVLKALSEN